MYYLICIRERNSYQRELVLFCKNDKLFYKATQTTRNVRLRTFYRNIEALDIILEQIDNTNVWCKSNSTWTATKIGHKSWICSRYDCLRQWNRFVIDFYSNLTVRYFKNAKKPTATQRSFHASAVVVHDAIVIEVLHQDAIDHRHVAVAVVMKVVRHDVVAVLIWVRLLVSFVS
jgi:hypothetical protein